MGEVWSQDLDQRSKAASSKPQGPRNRPQARPQKWQAASFKLDKAWALGYSGIMKFIFEGKTYEFKNMEEANAELPLGDGAWFGPEEGMPANTHKWEKGNFFD